MISLSLIFSAAGFILLKRSKGNSKATATHNMLTSYSNSKNAHFLVMYLQRKHRQYTNIDFGCFENSLLSCKGHVLLTSVEFCSLFLFHFLQPEIRLCLSLKFELVLVAKSALNVRKLIALCLTAIIIN